MPNLPNFRRQAMGDVVPAMLEPGEFVINRNAVNALGVDNLEVLNDAGGAHSAIDELIASATVASTLQNARPPHYQQGGEVYGYQGGGFIDRLKRSFVDDKGFFRGETSEAPVGAGSYGPGLNRTLEAEYEARQGKPMDFEGEKSRFHGVIGMLNDMRLKKELEGQAADFRREFTPYGPSERYSASVSTPSKGGGYGLSLGYREKDFGPFEGQQELFDERYQSLKTDPRMVGAQEAIQRRSEQPSNIVELLKGMGGYQGGGQVENGKKPKKTLDQLLLELQLMEMHGSDKDKIPKGSPLEPVFSAMGKYPHHPKYLIDGEWVSGNPDMDDSTMMNAPMRMMFYTPDKGWVGMETILGYDEYQSYKNIDKQSLKKEIGFKSPKSGNNYQEGGQVYQGPPYEPSEADFGRQVNPFTGEEMNIAEDKKRMALQMLKSLGVGKGQRIDSDAMDSLMGMSDDRRIIPPLPPDEYVMRQENGEMYMSKQQVPKLSPAYMASFGMETPLSKRQRSLLQRRAINPESISPQLHGLLGKVLLQRLENEPE